MANPTIEAPRGVAFPEKCASCGNPMVEKKVNVRRLTQAAQGRQTTGYLLLGAIGAAIAGATAGEDKYVQFGIPLCRDCAARGRNIRIAAWVTFVLGLLGFFLTPMIVAATDADAGGMAAGAAIAVGAILLIVSVILFIIGAGQQPVKIKGVKDAVGGVVLSFRNAEYMEEFRRLNSNGLVPYALRAGLPLPVSTEQALAIVSSGIDDEQPAMPATLSGHFMRAQIYLRADSYAQAVQELNQVVAVGGYNPYMPEALFLRGQALLNLARYQEAAADLDGFIRSSGDRRKVGEAKKLRKQIGEYV